MAYWSGATGSWHVAYHHSTRHLELKPIELFLQATAGTFAARFLNLLTQTLLHAIEPVEADLLVLDPRTCETELR